MAVSNSPKRAPTQHASHWKYLTLALVGLVLTELVGSGTSASVSADLVIQTGGNLTVAAAKTSQSVDLQTIWMGVTFVRVAKPTPLPRVISP